MKEKNNQQYAWNINPKAIINFLLQPIVWLIYPVLIVGYVVMYSIWQALVSEYVKSYDYLSSYIEPEYSLKDFNPSEINLLIDLAVKAIKQKNNSIASANINDTKQETVLQESTQIQEILLKIQQYKNNIFSSSNLSSKEKSILTEITQEYSLDDDSVTQLADKLISTKKLKYTKCKKIINQIIIFSILFIATPILLPLSLAKGLLIVFINMSVLFKEKFIPVCKKIGNYFYSCCKFKDQVKKSKSIDSSNLAVSVLFKEKFIPACKKIGNYFCSCCKLKVQVQEAQPIDDNLVEMQPVIRENTTNYGTANTTCTKENMEQTREQNMDQTRERRPS